MSDRDDQGRFAATSSANPHSVSPAQPFGYAKPYNHSNPVAPPDPIDLVQTYGRKGAPRTARMPGGDMRPLGMVSDLALQLGPPVKPEQQEPQQAEPAGRPVQPPRTPQESAAEPRPVMSGSMSLPPGPSAVPPMALPGSGRLALPAGPSAVETMTPAGPIPPAVDGLLEGKRPASYSVVSLGSKYTRSAHPNALGGLAGGLDE